MSQTSTKTQINTFLKTHPEWTTNPKGTALQRMVKLESYIDGVVAIARISVHAEMLQHHPDIVFKYGKLKITLQSHDVKGVTTRDLTLAERIDTLFT